MRQKLRIAESKGKLSVTRFSNSFWSSHLLPYLL